MFGTSTSACLRSIGAIISPATALADTVDVTLMRMGLLENTESAPEQESSRRSTTTLSSIKKGLIVWMVKLHGVDDVVDLDTVYVSLLNSLCIGSCRTDR